MENFTELNLSPALSKSIEEMGFTAPTPIQAQTIPLLLEGPTDFLGLAATGTGKTAAFGIPLLEGLNNSRQEVQALVLCPTRELALQVTEQLNMLGKHKKLRAVPVYGGSGYSEQIRGLKGGAQVVVATPGRLIDHLERGNIRLEKIKTVVLDEADEMISMGFKDDLEKILEMLEAGSYNTWLFSATMSRDIRRVADRFMTEPKVVQANKSEMLSGTVRQIYFKVKETDKPDILCKLMDMEDNFYGLIFCQTKSLVMDLTTLLTSRGYKVDCLHGDKDQNQRERTMRAFKDRRVNVLVCTDVASRGIDVKDLTHVINYSIPRELDNYVHRIGRTGRSGKNGVAYSLVTPSHQGLVGRIEQMTQVKMELGSIPTRKDIGQRKVSKLLERFMAVTTHDRVETHLAEDWLAALEGMPKTEIASRLLVLTFPEVFVDNDKSQQAKMPGKPEFEGDRRPRREDRFERRERFSGPREERFEKRPRVQPRQLDVAPEGADEGLAGPLMAAEVSSRRVVVKAREARPFGEHRERSDRPERSTTRGAQPWGGRRKKFDDQERGEFRPGGFRKREFGGAGEERGGGRFRDRDSKAGADRPRSYERRPARSEGGFGKPRRSFGRDERDGGGKPPRRGDRPNRGRSW